MFFVNFGFWNARKASRNAEAQHFPLRKGGFIYQSTQNSFPELKTGTRSEARGRNCRFLLLPLKRGTKLHFGSVAVAQSADRIGPFRQTCRNADRNRRLRNIWQTSFITNGGPPIASRFISQVGSAISESENTSFVPSPRASGPAGAFLLHFAT